MKSASWTRKARLARFRVCHNRRGLEILRERILQHAGTSEQAPCFLETSQGQPGRQAKIELLSDLQGEVVPKEKVKEWLCEVISGDAFPYGYQKLTAVLKQEYGLIVNHKKVYRLCKELGILLPQRKKKFSRPRQLARETSAAPTSSGRWASSTAT